MYQSCRLVTKLNFMKIVVIIPQLIWTLLGSGETCRV